MTTPPMSEFDSKQNWPEGAIEDWKHGASYTWISDKYGRAYSTVAKLIKGAKVLGETRVVDIANRKRNGGGARFHDQRPLGPIHLRIGLLIGRFREVDNVYTCSELAEKLQTSRIVARKMELGLHDLTLTEMCRIADIIGMQLHELVGEGSLAADRQERPSATNYLPTTRG